MSNQGVPTTKSDLMAGVYESIAKAKDRQLLWAIGRLSEVERDTAASFPGRRKDRRLPRRTSR